MRGNGYRFAATWETEVGREEKFLSRRGVQAQEQVAHNRGDVSCLWGFSQPG